MSADNWKAVLLNADHPIAIQNEFDTESHLHYQAKKLIGEGSFGSVFLSQVFHRGQLLK